MARHPVAFWSWLVFGSLLGEALLILAFLIVLEPRIELRWTVALSPFAAGLWVVLRLVTEPVLPDAHPGASEILRLTMVFTAGFASLAAGFLLLRDSGLV